MPDDVPAARVLEVIRAAGGALLRGAEVFDVYRGAQVGEGRASLAIRLEFRAPDRTLTDEEVAQRREKIVAALARAGRGRAAWLAVAVLGASGYAGAIAAMLVHRHPFFDARARDRARGGRRAARRHPPAHARAAGARDRGTRTRQSDVDAALVCWPHRVAAPAVAALRERGVRVVDLSADFRLRDRGIYEDWYGDARRARSCSARASTGSPSCTATDVAGADLVANPGCYPTAALLALAPLARAGLIGDVVIDAKSGVSGAGREPTASDALHLRRREHDALQGRPPPPHAGDRAGARRPRRAA